MVVSIDECKKILGITVNTYDEKFRQLIPYVQEDIIYYCNNPFADETIFVQDSNSFDFMRGNTATLTTAPDYVLDALDRFSTVGFTGGMDIIIVGGSNEGVFTVSTVSTNKMTMTCTGEFVTQSQTTNYQAPGTISIHRAIWPKAVKLAAAKMVWYLIENPKQGDAQSERIDDYSITYAGNNAYPERILMALKTYRRAILI